MSTERAHAVAAEPSARAVATVAAAERGRRYETIDTLRGIALIMMVASHTTNDQLTTWSAKLTHTDRWIGGAAFFVMLSGVVLGIVHRRLVDRTGGLEASRRKLVRRAGLIYVIQVALVTLMVSMKTWLPDSHIAYDSPWSEIGGIPLGLLKIALFREEPIDVLPLYVVFLLAAIPMVWLLHRGRYVLYWAVTLGVYAASQVVPLSFSPGTFSIGAWQLLFFGGLVVGWTWEHERLLVPEHLRRAAVVGCVAFAGVMLVGSNLAYDSMQQLFGPALAKQAGGWLAFVFGAALVVSYYVVVDRARRVRFLLPPLRLVETIGSKTLPAYTAMCVAIVALAPIPVSQRTDLAVLGVLVVTSIAAVVGLRFDAWRKRRSARSLLVTPTMT